MGKEFDADGEATKYFWSRKEQVKRVSPAKIFYSKMKLQPSDEISPRWYP